MNINDLKGKEIENIGFICFILISNNTKYPTKIEKLAPNKPNFGISKKDNSTVIIPPKRLLVNAPLVLFALK